MSETNGANGNSAAETTPRKHPKLHPTMLPWRPGQSGNPEGRPKGSRNKLGEAFLAAMYEDWKLHGVAAIEKVRTDRPHDYLKVVASILPKDLNVRVNDHEQMTDDELIARIRTLAGIVRPFLDVEGTGELAGGAEAEARH